MRDTEPRQPYAAWSSSECCVDCRNACASSRHFIARSSNTSRRLGSTVLAAARIQSSACTAPHVDSVQKLKSGAHMVGGGPPFSVQSGRTPPRQKGISLGETQNSRGSVGGGDCRESIEPYVFGLHEAIKMQANLAASRFNY
jgi:hypothetical protein